MAGCTSPTKERVLALTAYGTYPVPDPAADEKTLDARVEALIAARETARTTEKGAMVPSMPTSVSTATRGHLNVGERGDI